MLVPDCGDVQRVFDVQRISGCGASTALGKGRLAMAAKSRPGDGQHARGRKGGSRLGPDVHVGGLFKSLMHLVKGIVAR